LSLPQQELIVDAAPDATRDRVTLRAVLIGIALVAFVNAWTVYGLYVIHINQMVFSYMPMALMIPFVVLALGINLLLRRFFPALAFSPLELAVVFSMGLIGAMFPAMNYTGLIMGHMASPYYFASPENGWSEFLHPHLTSWMFPGNANGEMRNFFEGMPRGDSIPWGVWLGPLFWWFSFAGALVWTCLCVAVIVRKQWAELERLPFPAAQVALEMVQKDKKRVLPPMLQTRAFWIGMAVPLAVICWNMISYFEPRFPTIPITQVGGGHIRINVTRYVPSYYFFVGINFFIMGFAYWTSLEVLFSIVFFYAVVVAEVWFFNRIGYSVDTPGLWSSGNVANAWQAFGALTFLVVWGLWMARDHLGGVWRKIRYNDPSVDDSEELMSFRLAGIGLLVGVVFIVGWLNASGMEMLVVIPFLFAMAVLYIGIARIVAESGLVYLRGTMMPPTFALFAVGSARISPRTMATFAHSYGYFTDAKSLAMSSTAHCAKIASVVRGNKKPFVFSLAAAGLAAVITSVAFTMYLAYQTGAYNFGAFEFSTHPMIFDYFVNKTKTSLSPDWVRMAFYVGGAAFMGVMTLVRYRWPWWPIHPVGFAIMETRAVRDTIFTIFLVWVIKLLVLRVGGIALYRRGQPFFLGILVGFILGTGLSAVVDTVWFPGEGHSVHTW